MKFDLGDIDNITQVKVYVNINDVADVKLCNQPSTIACRYRRHALSSLLNPLHADSANPDHFAVVKIRCPTCERLISRWRSRSYCQSCCFSCAKGRRARRRRATEVRRLHDAIPETQWQIPLRASLAMSRGL